MTPNINPMNPNISFMANQIIGNIMGQNPMISTPYGMFQPQVMSMQPKIDPALKKVFVKNIPEDVPDSFMESILQVNY